MAYRTHESDGQSNNTRMIWFIAGGALVAAVGAGLYAYNGGFAEEDKVSIELTVPNVDVPKVELPKVDLPQLQTEPMRTPTVK